MQRKYPDMRLPAELRDVIFHGAAILISHLDGKLGV